MDGLLIVVPSGLNPVEAYPHPIRGFCCLLEQQADRPVTVRSHADTLPNFQKRSNQLTSCVRFPATRWPLNAQRGLIHPSNNILSGAKQIRSVGDERTSSMVI